MQRTGHPIRACLHDLASVVSVTMLAAVVIHAATPSATAILAGVVIAGTAAATTLHRRHRRIVAEPVALAEANARVAAWFARPPLAVHLTDSAPGHAWLEDGQRIFVDRSLLATGETSVVGILAHEYGHASERHGINRLVTVVLLAAPASCGWISQLTEMTVATTVTALVSLLVRRGLCRHAEYLADAAAVAAGGDVARAGIAANLNPFDRRRSLWHTHPPEAARLCRLAGLATSRDVRRTNNVELSIPVR